MAGRGCKDGEDTVRKGKKSTQEIAIGSQRRENCVMYWLSAVVTWNLEMISNKVVNLAEDVSRQNAESVIWLILAALL